MVNRIFLLSEHHFTSDDPRPGEGFYSSQLFSSQDGDAAGKAYIAASDGDWPGLVLTLKLVEPISPEMKRAVTSFFFLPSYLRIGGRPVLNLTGDDMALCSLQEADLRSYLLLQGFYDPMINIVPLGEVFHSPEAFVEYYRELLGRADFYGKDLYFHSPSGELSQAVRAGLQKAEEELGQREPRLYSTIRRYLATEAEMQGLAHQLAATGAELAHQKQYVDMLRTDHQAKEIQDFYNREYEILPLWYKRLGHLVKVLSGKRTFRSLFRDDVKKYKD